MLDRTELKCPSWIVIRSYCYGRPCLKKKVYIVHIKRPQTLTICIAWASLAEKNHNRNIEKAVYENICYSFKTTSKLTDINVLQ